MGDESDWPVLTSRSGVYPSVDPEAILDGLARRYHWWHTPRQARADQAHFLCQLMQLGTYEDVRTARRILGDDAFRAALAAAPPGVLDDRSWNF